MAKDILSLAPAKVWEYFYELTQIPRPTGHMEQVTKFVFDFGKSLGLDTKMDEVGNVLITKPATPGMENLSTVILQSHVDMVPQKNADKVHDFLKDPIDAHIDGKVVRANNTTLGADNGLGAAAMMAVLADKTLKHGKLEALFTIDEEVGMIGAFGLKPGFLTGSILLNLDTEEIGDLCVGCAGGADVNVDWQYKDVEVPEGDVAYRLSVTGLKGGHSGTEIHVGRANANKLLFRFLKEAVADCEVRLSWVDGGSLRNAIPREAFAIVTLPEEDVEDFLDLVSEFEEIYREEYKAADPNISFKAEKTELPKTLIPEEIQDSLIHAVVGCQNGVISVLSDSIFAGTIETSTNLASVKSKEGIIEAKMLTRSSSETKKAEICSSLDSIFSLAGARVSIENPYPGWQPNAQSDTLNMMRDLYKEMFNEEARVSVVHAGLECGIILASTPGLDIVSFGPTILNAHSPGEYIEIDTVEPFYDYLIKTLERIK
ncbi:aminoacyl-histidine dipeptidase [Dysgonomonas massiliensis]|uniref:aminoacyl-histidine dipeptidase n=1 Tax=Dysgonomonas massiliensis TaxID=2040292 RepID=UPI000C75F62D|nr:aminoacyl-histidine dipeptidase [Dysgonomonas massiliensis]